MRHSSPSELLVGFGPAIAISKFYGLPKLLLSGNWLFVASAARRMELLKHRYPFREALSIAMTLGSKAGVQYAISSRSQHIDLDVYVMSNRISRPNLSQI
jgi:hypothetical protein